MIDQMPTSKPKYTIRFFIGWAGVSTLITLVLMAAAALLSGEATVRTQTSPIALLIHVATVVPALFLGAFVMWGEKGTQRHKLLGRIWAALMLITAISSFWIKGMTGSVGPIHAFSVLALVSIPRAIYLIRKGDVEGHQKSMMGVYIGLVVAGLFSFIPGRLMGSLVF